MLSQRIILCSLVVVSLLHGRRHGGWARVIQPDQADESHVLNAPRSLSWDEDFDSEERSPQDKYTTKPRVRREWRTLSDEMKHRVADAFWTLRNYTTEEGQAIFGPNYYSFDYFLMMHICSVLDPRCDQG